MSRTSTEAPLAPHLPEEHQLDIKSRTVRQNRTNSRTSTGVDNHWTYTEEQSAIHSTSGQSAGHLLKDHQHNILLEIINKTSTRGLSAGHYWRTNSRTSNGRPSTGHYTGGISAWHLLTYHQQDLYWRIISRLLAGSTGGSSTGHLLEDHQQDRTSTADHKQDIYW